MNRVMRPGKWLRPWMLPWLIGGAVFFLVASTTPHYGLTWDEPNYFYASDLEIRWLVEFGKNLLEGKAARSLDDDIIKAAWHWDPYHVPHPPFSRIVSGLTKSLFSSFIDKFTAYRLAPAFFFALLVTVMYLWMAEIFDRTTAIFSAITLVLTPNLFGFAHFAVTDMPLTALWFLTVYCFWRGLRDWRWSLVLGVVWGLALSTKFPSLLIPIPLLLWAHIYHRRSYANNLFAMIFLSPLVMIASQPYLWHQTSRRIFDFLYDGLSRGFRPETNFPIYFFGRLYFTSELPWYYPFFITGVTTPEPILALILVRLIVMPWIKPQREVIVLALLSTLFILVMGLFPGAVLHDGARQLLPVSPFLVVLASGGFFVLAKYLKEWSLKVVALQRIKYLQSKLTGILFLSFCLPSALDLFVYHPYELSYYNRLVGGIRGAFQRGLEVTYFAEAFTPEFLRHLDKELPPNAVINAYFSNPVLTYYQREGRLRKDIRITDGTDYQYFVLLTRRSTFGENANFLFNNVRSYDALRLDGVPLIALYKAKSQS